MKKLIKLIKTHWCDHEYFMDIQIKVIRCDKCEHEEWYHGDEQFPQKNLWPNYNYRKQRVRKYTK